MRGSTRIQAGFLSALVLVLSPCRSLCFSNTHQHRSKIISTERESCLLSQSTGKNKEINLSSTLQQTLSQSLLGIALASSVLLTPTLARAAEDGAAPPASITACTKNPNGAATNCISTKNVKQLDLYSPPWTFETSAEEVAARIKGVVAADPYLELKSSTTTGTNNDNTLLTIKGTRSLATDTIELLINPTDQVVTFRAQQDGDQPPPVSDFGAIRKELESIRQKSKIIGVMGQGMSADAMPSQNGPLGQLKAFYGLQSGQGFEDIYDE